MIMEEVLMSNFRRQLEAHRENATALSMPEKIILYTDKQFMIHDQEQRFLLSSAKKATISNSNGLHSSTSPGPLLAQNRVIIKTLARNLDQVIAGKFFLCRCITPPQLMTSIMTVVDDPEGRLAVRLSLYNYKNAEENLESVFPVGMILAIKNPWFKQMADGGLAVQCDNPSDIKVISPTFFEALFPKLEWRGEIPIDYRDRAICSSEESRKKLKLVQELNNLGNKHFVEKKFIDAIRSYTQALTISSNNTGILVNRGAAYLTIGCYRRALEDLKVALEKEPFHIKGIYRTVKSFWGLRKYAEAVELLNSKFKEKPSLLRVKELFKLKENADKMVAESSTGKFDELDIAMKKEKMEELEISDYIGQLEIREITGKGRGLATKEKVAPGQLIITEKAFAFHKKPKPGISVAISLNSETNSMNVEGHDELIELIAQKLRIEPELGKDFYKLYAGPVLGSLQDDDEALDKVDIKRIDKIVTYNAFSSVRVEDSPPSMMSLEESETKKGSGVWILPSYINHSCLDANCTWDLVGDVMFIRAVKPIRKGEEILISYMDPISSYDKRCCEFRSHSFTCECLLCKLDSKESEATQRTRSQILEMFQIEASRISRGNMPNFKLIRDNLSRLTSLRQKWPLLNYYMTGKSIDVLCQALFTQRYTQISAEILEMGYPVLKRINVLTVSACNVSLNILCCYVVQRKREKVKEWIEKVKTDLILAYGSIEVIRVYGPLTLQTIERFGYNFFE